MTGGSFTNPPEQTIKYNVPNVDNKKCLDIVSNIDMKSYVRNGINDVKKERA